MKHTRSGFVCNRCGNSFSTRAELVQHQQQEESCPRGLPDPQNGIDRDAVGQLLTRSRRIAPSEADEWREIWQLLFPAETKVMPSRETPLPLWLTVLSPTTSTNTRDPSEPPEYCAVIEHFELKDMFLESWESFTQQLSAHFKENNVPLVEEVSSRCKSHFLTILELCNERSRNVPYENDQSRRSDPSSSQGSRARSSRAAATPSLTTGSIANSNQSSHRGGRGRTTNPSITNLRMTSSTQETRPIAPRIPLEEPAQIQSPGLAPANSEWSDTQMEVIPTNDLWINSTQFPELQDIATMEDQTQEPGFWEFVSAATDDALSASLNHYFNPVSATSPPMQRNHGYYGREEDGSGGSGLSGNQNDVDRR